MNTDIDRRISLYIMGGAAALVTAGCTQQQVDDTAKKVADIINQVQAGVAQACAAVGKIVPTANSVLAVLAAIIGSTNIVVATAAMISQAVAEIVAVGCPATPPTPQASGGKTPGGANVVFY